MSFLHSLQLDGFLSFRPGSQPIELTPLNVLIGPNASGKSNVIEAVELLHATPTDLAAAVRLGGSPGDWIWKGDVTKEARLAADLVVTEFELPIRISYCLAFSEAPSGRLRVVDEVVQRHKGRPTAEALYYSLTQHVLHVSQIGGSGLAGVRRFDPDELDHQQSILSQRKDPVSYPALTALANAFGRIQTFREWSIGRLSAPRLAQPTDQASGPLHADGSNLGLVLNDLEHSDAWPRFNECMRRFLPRFSRVSTRVQAGSVQIYLREDGLRSPVPATRLSDGTIRFMALLAVLLRAESSPLICVEEPELGLHPDALALIAELLVEASTKSQLIVTTQSDALISALSEHADSVIVCEHRDGATELERLESEKLRFWLDKYRLGEIWRIGKLGGDP